MGVSDLLLGGYDWGVIDKGSHSNYPMTPVI